MQKRIDESIEVVKATSLTLNEAEFSYDAGKIQTHTHTYRYGRIYMSYRRACAGVCMLRVVEF